MTVAIRAESLLAPSLPSARETGDKKNATQVGNEEAIMQSVVRTILHPTDFSPLSNLAFEVACALARNEGARGIVSCCKS